MEGLANEKGHLNCPFSFKISSRDTNIGVRDNDLLIEISGFTLKA